MLSRGIKTRRESLIEFEKGNRDDLIEKTNQEIEFLQGYLPKQLSSQELEKIIDEVFVKVGGRRRVYDVFVDGQKLDPDKKYTIASNSFILGGGDGYSMFAPYPELKSSIGVDNEILLKYIQEYLSGEVPVEYNTTQNRIYISEGKDMTNPDVTPFTHSGDGFILVYKLVLILVLLLF